MNKKRTYFPKTTQQQRRLLFEIWEETGDRNEACRRAHVAVSTFYNWKPRFEAGGYAGLETERSRAPKTYYQTPPEIEEKVVAMRQENPDWGKRRITDELSKGNHWIPLVSPNTVKRILVDADLWPQAENSAKKGAQKTEPAQPKPPDKP